MFAGSITMGQAAMKEQEVGFIELPRDMNFPETGKHLTPRQSAVQVMVPVDKVFRRILISSLFSSEVFRQQESQFLRTPR